MDEVNYRWIVSDADFSVLVLIVENYDNPASQLHVRFGFEYSPYTDSSGKIRERRYQLNAITPSVVRGAIEAALAQGWDPMAKLPGSFRLSEKASARVSELALGKSGPECGVESPAIETA